MSLSTWFGLLAICCLGAMSPGLSLAMVVRHTLGGGRSKGIVCAWAHSIGIGFYALITLLGLAVALKKAPLLFNGIAIMGALYLAGLVFSRCAQMVVCKQNLPPEKQLIHSLRRGMD